MAEANDLKGVIDVADFNDEDRLGKSKGQFYTPAEVSTRTAHAVGQEVILLHGVLFRGNAEAECIFELVKNQNEY